MKMKEIIDRYTRIISERPFTALAVILVGLIFLSTGASKVKTVDQQTQDLLPDSVASVHAFDVIDAEFGSASGTTYTVLFQTDPHYANSTEVRDLRDPRFIHYLETVSNDVSYIQKVTTVNSVADIVDQPSSIRETQSQLDATGKGSWSRYLSDGYSYAIMRVTATGLTADEENEVADQIRNSVETIEQPAGLEIGYTGNPYINQAFEQQTQSTMSNTGILSLVGVLVVVVLLFRSFISGLISLNALIFGIISGFGLYGWLGLNMSPATSGAISMGMGIAIDFGIQVVSRYQEEREDKEIQEALSETITGVISPMSIALVAAIIGFTSLTIGRITFLSSLGTMLMLTTTFAYLGALTLLPVALVIYDRHLKKFIPSNLYSRIFEKILR